MTPVIVAVEFIRSEMADAASAAWRVAQRQAHRGHRGRHGCGVLRFPGDGWAGKPVIDTEIGVRVVDLLPGDERVIRQCAALLVEGFREHWPNVWPDMDAALTEVHECLESGNITRVALDDDGDALGWVGGRPAYDGHVWELHPLVVRSDRQGQGIGRGAGGRSGSRGTGAGRIDPVGRHR